MTEADLMVLLRQRYGTQGDRYAFLPQCSNGTGGNASRYCDALAISLWPSDGLEWHGHELKVTRADWLHELQDPDKADAFARYCHRWWIVAPPGVVAHMELRPGWGLLIANGEKLRVSVGAVKQQPEDLPRRMLGAIIRRVMEAAPGEQEVAALQRAIDDAKGRCGDLEHAAKCDREALAALRKSVSDFEQASGLRIDAYNGRHLGERVAMAERATWTRYHLQAYERLAETVRGLSATVEESLAAARALSEEEVQT